MTRESRTHSHGTRRAEQAALDRAFEALGHPSRRRILTTLVTSDPRDGDDLTPAGFVRNDEELEESLVRLHHTHLPHLDEAGFVDWNRETETVRRGPRYDEIAPLVELLRDHADELPADWP